MNLDDLDDINDFRKHEGFDENEKYNYIKEKNVVIEKMDEFEDFEDRRRTKC